MQEDYQKAFKKLTICFLSNPVPFNGWNYQRHTELVALQITKQVQKYSLLCYSLSEQVWWCNVKQLLSYSKNCICKFMQVNWWHHKSFHFHLSFWIWKVWKGREKITKIWISREWKELFRWNKKHFFIIFKGL